MFFLEDFEQRFAGLHREQHLQNAINPLCHSFWALWLLPTTHKIEQVCPVRRVSKESEQAIDSLLVAALSEQIAQEIRNWIAQKRAQQRFSLQGFSL